MEIKHRSKEYLILEDIPLVGPVMAYSFIGVGFLPIIIIFTRFPQHKLLALWGLLVSLFGVFLTFRLKEQSKVILDRSKNALVIFRKKPLGSGKEKVYELSDIKEIKIETNLKHNGQRLVAHFKDGQLVPFTNHFKNGMANSYPGMCRMLMKYLNIPEQE